jgi:PPOX class probable FMN-dependent enzyme
MGDVITTEAELRALYGAPKKLPALAKAQIIDDLCRRFITLSSLVCISSCDREGRQDVSPRGDGPGFVHALDATTIAIPDRPGNNKLETLSNILVNPRVALLFIIPGHEETLRLNGVAKISRDPTLLAKSAVDGRLPKAMIVIKVEEIYPHCGKAFRRAHVWEPQSRPDRAVPWPGSATAVWTRSPPRCRRDTRPSSISSAHKRPDHGGVMWPLVSARKI